jgi:hypothetical protein
MKTTRKPIALLVVCTLIIGLFASFSGAATTTTQADALKAGGLFNGTTTGYDLEGILTRDQGITLALRAQGMEPAVMAQTEVDVAITLGKVADADKIPGWARKAVAFALKQSPAITTGVSKLADGRLVFAPGQKMSGSQFIAFMARAMGYDATLSTGLDIAVTNKLLSPSQVVSYASVLELKRGQAVDIMYSAVRNGIVAATGKTLIEKLVESGIVTTAAGLSLGYAAAATPTPSPVTEIPSVVSVAAENCKELKITFSHEMNINTIISTAFVVKDKGITTKPATPILGSDKKTVMLTLADGYSLTNGSEATLIVKKTIRSAMGANLASEYENDAVEVMDGKLPLLTSVSAVGKHTLVLLFDEPVWNGTGNIIDPLHFSVIHNGSEYYVESALADSADHTVTLRLGIDLVAGSYTVKCNALGRVEGSVQDFAGYKMSVTEKPFSYTPDLTVATASIQSINRLTQAVVVKFSKPVYGSKVHLYQMVANVDSYGSVAVTVSEENASDTWTFNMKNAIATGSLKFYLVGSTVDSEKLVDLFGIAVPNATMSYTLVADMTPPHVTDVAVSSDSTVTISFNEELYPSEADLKSNYEVRNVSGSLVNIADAQLQEDGMTVRLLCGIEVGKTYAIKVKSMTDISGNVMSLYSITKTVIDDTNPKVTAAYAVAAQRKIFITFSKPMNLEELGNKNNYLVDLNGGTDAFRSMTAGETVVVTDSTHVVLTFSTTLSNPSVKMAAIHGQDGLKLGSNASFEYTGEAGNLLNLGTETVSLVSADLVDGNMVQLTFNTRMAGLAKDDILIRQKSNGSAFSTPVKISSVLSTEVNDSGDSVMLVRLDRTLNADATYNDNTAGEAVEIQVSPSATISTSGSLIKAVTHTSALDLNDLMSGSIAKDAGGYDIISWNDFDGNGKLDTVVVKYTEAILESTLSTLIYTVSGYTVTGASIDSDGIVTAGHAGDHNASAKYVILNITKPGQTADAGTEPAVMQVYPISDTNGNVIE